MKKFLLALSLLATPAFAKPASPSHKGASVKADDTKTESVSQLDALDLKDNRRSLTDIKEHVNQVDAILNQLIHSAQTPLIAHRADVFKKYGLDMSKGDDVSDDGVIKRAPPPKTDKEEAAPVAKPAEAPKAAEPPKNPAPPTPTKK